MEGLKKAVQNAINMAKQMASTEAGSTKPPPGAGSGRPMKFPYTFTAKVVQFPWMFYIKHNWLYRYYAIALVVTFPVFAKIHFAMNSPANVEKWKEIRRKEREEEHHH